MALNKKNESFSESKQLFSDNEAVMHRTRELTDEMITSMNVEEILNCLAPVHKQKSILSEEYYRTTKIHTDMDEYRDQKIMSTHRFYNALAVKLNFTKTPDNNLLLDMIHWVDKEINLLTKEQFELANSRMNRKKEIIQEIPF